MFEVVRIKLFGIQPAAKVTDKILARLIQRDFGNKASEVKQKFQQVISETDSSKNRICAAILKLSNKDFAAIDHFVKMSNGDFRDVISQAEYPRCSKLDFYDAQKQKMKQIYLDDWSEYTKWLNE